MDVMFCGLIWFKLKSSFSAPVERAALAELCKHTSQIWGEDAARRVLSMTFLIGDGPAMTCQTVDFHVLSIRNPLII